MSVTGGGYYGNGGASWPAQWSFLRPTGGASSLRERSMRQFLSSECRRAVVDGIRVLENVYVWRNSVVFELEKIWWNGCPECIRTLWYLRKVYVVDSFRGRGVGEQFVSALKRWCDASGSVVSLCAVGFCLRSSELSVGCSCFDSVEGVLRCWRNDLIMPSGLDLLLGEFYSRMGFENAPLTSGGDHSVSGDVCIRKQFVYVGSRVSAADRSAILERRNDECGCELCQQ